MNADDFILSCFGCICILQFLRDNGLNAHISRRSCHFRCIVGADPLEQRNIKKFSHRIISQYILYQLSVGCADALANIFRTECHHKTFSRANSRLLCLRQPKCLIQCLTAHCKNRSRSTVCCLTLRSYASLLHLLSAVILVPIVVLVSIAILILIVILVSAIVILVSIVILVPIVVLVSIVVLILGIIRIIISAIRISHAVQKYIINSSPCFQFRSGNTDCNLCTAVFRNLNAGKFHFVPAHPAKQRCRASPGFTRGRCT